MLRFSGKVICVVSAILGFVPIGTGVLAFLQGKGIVSCLLVGVLPACAVWCTGFYVVALGEATTEVLERLRRLDANGEGR